MLIEDLAKYRFAWQRAGGKRVLDAGCGAGQGSQYLAAQGAGSVIGLDVAPDAVRYAKSHHTLPNLAFAIMDGGNLGMRNGQFDLITSIEVIEHLQEPEQYLAEIRRLLVDDGWVVLSTPNQRISSPNPGMLWPYHVREFDPDELERMLRKHFARVEMWGTRVPVYDDHPVRRLMHFVAPVVKPILPHRLRVASLPAVQQMIRKELDMDDVVFSRRDYASQSTLIALCRP